MALVFNPNLKYIVYAELPNTKKRISLGMIRNRDEWNEYVRIYSDFFSMMVGVEYNMMGSFNNKAREVLKATNKKIKQKIVIPRFKREKKKPLKGNLLVKEEEGFCYIQVSHFKKRKVLKIDSEDLDNLKNITKNSYYFIARKFSKGEVCYILSKKKYRTNSIYTYILGEKILTKVVHIDGDYSNFTKSNLHVLPTNHVTIKKMEKNKVFKNDEKLVGFSVDSQGRGYEIRIVYNKRRVKIGYSSNKEECAKIYDIAMMYYHGIHGSVNYPSDYYFNFEQELVSKWNDNLKKRKIQPTFKVGMEIDIIDNRLYRQKENEDEKRI